MLEENKVSILIPVFNREKYIAECIESAIKQSYKNIEIIVIDNCSSDDTWKICEVYKLKDSRIKIYQNLKNIGPVANWLKCAENATGKFCKILFSDDKLHPECIKSMVTELISDDVGLVYSTARIGNTEDNSVVAYWNKSEGLINSLDYLELLKKGMAPYSPGAILIRTKDLISFLKFNIDTKCKHDYWKHGAGPDLMISLLALKKYRNIKYISKSLVFFRSHENSFSVQNVNNEIQYSYWATMSLFLKQNCSKGSWIKYLAYTWLIDSRRLKKIVPPNMHIKNYEGNGSLKELIMMFYYVFLIIASKIIRKL